MTEARASTQQAGGTQPSVLTEKHLEWRECNQQLFLVRLNKAYKCPLALA